MCAKREKSVRLVVLPQVYGSVEHAALALS